jgi:hypothetical protein
MSYAKKLSSIFILTILVFSTHFQVNAQSKELRHSKDLTKSNEEGNTENDDTPENFVTLSQDAIVNILRNGNSIVSVVLNNSGLTQNFDLTSEISCVYGASTLDDAIAIFGYQNKPNGKVEYKTTFITFNNNLNAFQAVNTNSVALASAYNQPHYYWIEQDAANATNLHTITATTHNYLHSAYVPIAPFTSYSFVNSILPKINFFWGQFSTPLSTPKQAESCS